MARIRSAHDAFPLEFGIFETQEQGEFQTGDIQVADHLCQMSLVKSRDNFGIHNHEASSRLTLCESVHGS